MARPYFCIFLFICGVVTLLAETKEVDDPDDPWQKMAQWNNEYGQLRNDDDSDISGEYFRGESEAPGTNTFHK